MHDLHVHSNYSDGAFLREMIAAAEAAGVNAIGFTDHCYVSSRRPLTDARAIVGMNLDRTYERRRHAIELLREETSVTVYDAVEMDYDPDDRADIRAFLETAGFDYAIGSVHRVDGANVQLNARFEDTSEAERDRIVNRYFRQLVDLIETELFEIVAHPDLPERTPTLRGRATQEQYRRVARAFENSRTVPEINAGRATDEGLVHPSDAFLEILLDHGVEFTTGSDAHDPSEVGERNAFLETFVENRGIDPLDPRAVLRASD